MALGVDQRSAGSAITKWILLGIGSFLLAGGITLAFFGMQSVMDVGGFCAQGGPYEIRQECPDTSWTLFVGVIAAIFGAGFMVAGTMRGGPRLVLLGWPALFLAFGWNFGYYAFNPPAPATGIAWGWLICAIVFIPMGLVPLLFMIVQWRRYFWSGSAASATTSRMTGSVSGLPFLTFTPNAGRTDPATVIVETATITPSGTAAPGPASADDLASALERLADLHAAGALTDEEFAAAKARLLEEGPTS